MTRIAVVGAGAWGTAMAIACQAAGHRVVLLTRDPALAAEMRRRRENPRALPGVRLAEGIEPVSDAARLGRAALVLTAVPASAVDIAGAVLAGVVPGGTPVISTAKGLDPADGTRPSERLCAALGPARPVLVLSGPNFAGELARGRPTRSVVAGASAAVAGEVAAILSGPAWDVEAGDDPVGVELGGALKNVAALASGMAEGLGMGDNARAAVETRALSDLSRVVVALGGRQDTVLGLSGVGDLIATVRGGASRNRQAGVAIALAGGALGRPDDAKSTVEGIASALGASRLGRRLGLDLPVVEAVADVVDGRATPRDAIARLLGSR